MTVTSQAASDPAAAPASSWVTSGGAAYQPSRATATAYVDGRDAFAQIAKDIEEAKKWIYFTGWAVWADVVMTQTEPRQTLLDLLQRATSRGVLVHAIVWHSPGLAILNFHEEEALDKLGKHKVRCFRHRPRLKPPWANHLKTIAIDSKIAWVGGIDLWHGRYDSAAHRVFDLSKRSRGDWYNTTLNADDQGRVEPAPDHPRMPWHDVHCRLEGDAASAVRESFLRRWDNTYPFGPSRDLSSDSKNVDQAPLDWRVTPRGGGSMDVQILRSLGPANGGDKDGRVERSIQAGYLNAIQNAQHFIYIESQFFISKVGKEQTPINTVMQTLAERIELALRQRKRFLVVLLIPTILDNPLNSLPVKGQLRWMTHTIGHGYDERPTGDKKSIELPFTGRVGTAYARAHHQKLPASVASEQSYLGVFTLRAAATPLPIRNQWTTYVSPTMPPETAGKCVSEQVYIHSKMMIVDDRVAIIGSANLNDRSLLGDRDSEMSAMIVDDASIAIAMDGEEYGYANRFAHDLRVRLWAEHLGLLDPHGNVPDDIQAQLSDPITAYDYYWLPAAKSNRAAFEEVFAETMPTDKQTTIDDRRVFDRMPSNPATPDTIKVLRRIRGHVTEYPLGWLAREPFKLGVGARALGDDSWFQ